jgi:hypothetical protein
MPLPKPGSTKSIQAVLGQFAFIQVEHSESAGSLRGLNRIWGLAARLKSGPSTNLPESYFFRSLSKPCPPKTGSTKSIKAGDALSPSVE